MREYRVKTRVELSTGIPEGRQDLVIFEKTRKQMAEKIAELIKGNDLLSYYVEGELSFHFCGPRMCLGYVFVCRDDSRKEAERFSKYGIKRMRDELKGIGCKIEHIYCHAEAAKGK